MSKPGIDQIEIHLPDPFNWRAELEGNEAKIMTEFDHADEEGQIKVVYAAAGLALYYSQCFEREIQNMLLTLSKVNGDICTAQDFEDLDTNLMQKTLGTVLRKARDVLDLDRNSNDLINAAVTQRNSLCHGYFYANAENFLSRIGRRTMVDDLLRRVACFRQADEICFMVTNGLRRMAGISDAVIEREFDRMLTAAKQRDLKPHHELG